MACGILVFYGVLGLLLCGLLYRYLAGPAGLGNLLLFPLFGIVLPLVVYSLQCFFEASKEQSQTPPSKPQTLAEYRGKKS